MQIQGNENVLVVEDKMTPQMHGELKAFLTLTYNGTGRAGIYLDKQALERLIAHFQRLLR